MIAAIRVDGGTQPQWNNECSVETLSQGNDQT
jgi:hypothetical protein